MISLSIVFRNSDSYFRADLWFPRIINSWFLAMRSALDSGRKGQLEPWSKIRFIFGQLWWCRNNGSRISTGLNSEPGLIKVPGEEEI